MPFLINLGDQNRIKVGSVVNPLVVLILFLLLLFQPLSGNESFALGSGSSHKKTLCVPMRDGSCLQTDLFFPEDEHLITPKSLPCILIRSPAGRNCLTAKHHIPLAKAGYILAIQETRSAQDKEGKTIPYRSDGWHAEQDGYDTVEWLAKHPLCNGKVGTLGSSAQGIAQHLLAPSAPPSLVCQYIGVAPPSLFHYAIYPQGKLMEELVHSWLWYYAGDPGIYSFVAHQPFFHEFWDEFNALKVVNQVQVPAFHQGGWFDPFLQGTIDGFAARQKEGGTGAKGTQKLLIGPWMHFWPATTQLGDFEVPLNGRTPPFDLSPLAWFGHYLQGAHNGIENLPPVTYYVMGPFDGSPSSGNVWKTAESWPPPAKTTPLYLTQDKALGLAPSSQSGSLAFTHDPQNPVPTLGGANLFITSGPVDQQPIEAREDLLVFSSAPVEQDLEITGNIKAHLYLSSDCQDTDVVVRLSDLYPDGRSILITDGIVRTGHLKNTREGNKPYEATIELGATSLVVAKGHALRISVSGSNSPRFEVNRNVGWIGQWKKPPVIAHTNIHMGQKTPSALLLPIVGP